MNFKIVGNRLRIRPDEELALVDKKAADAAFKRYKKGIIAPCLNAWGFRKYKSAAYVRKNETDLLEYIGFQKERYGSKTFTVNLAVMPLYLPHEYMGVRFFQTVGRPHLSP